LSDIAFDDDIFEKNFRKFALNAAQITWNQDPFRKLQSADGKPKFDIDFSKNPTTSIKNEIRSPEQPRSIIVEEVTKPSDLPPLPFSASLLPFTGKVPSDNPSKSRQPSSNDLQKSRRPSSSNQLQKSRLPSANVVQSTSNDDQRAITGSGLVSSSVNQEVRHRQLEEFEAALLQRQNSQQRVNQHSFARQTNRNVERKDDLTAASGAIARPAQDIGRPPQALARVDSANEVVTWTPAILQQEFEQDKFAEAQSQTATGSSGAVNNFADFSTFDTDFFDAASSNRATPRFTKSLSHGNQHQGGHSQSAVGLSGQQQPKSGSAYSFVSQSGPAFSYSSHL